MKKTIQNIISGTLSLAIGAANVFMLMPANSYAQADIHFSQFYETSILRNPALTGVIEADYKFGVYYRDQWSSISNPFQTKLVTAETRIGVSQNNNDFLSFGLLGYADKAGSIDQKIMAFYPAINYNKSISPKHNTYLSVGFTGGYVQYSFDPNKATFNTQYLNGHFNTNNPSLEDLPNAKMSMYDLGAGINFNSSSGKDNNITYIVGFSGYHFTKPKFSYYQSPGYVQYIRWNGNAAMGGYMTDKLALVVQGNYARQGTYSEIVVGGLLSWDVVATNDDQIFVLSGGAFYRMNDALIPVLKVKYRNMSLGISYDVNISPLNEASHMDGAYEVTLFITGHYPDKHNRGRKTVCPRF